MTKNHAKCHVLLAMLAATACANDDANPDPNEGGTPGECEATGEGVQVSRFMEGSLVNAVTEVPCTLTNGDESTCYRVEVVGEPANHEPGPWCPTHVDDGAEAGGKWFDGGVFYDLDGAFIENLATFYDDENWQLHDPDTGEISVTPAGQCMDGILGVTQNVCIECSMEEDVEGGGPVSQEFLIPTQPVRRSTPEELGAARVGLATNGVIFEGPAPTPIILSLYTIAALDDCGGHINPAEGYHYHAAANCSAASEAECDGHAALLGYARDGYAIHGMANANGQEPDDLDECRGHSDEERGYHYHAADPGSNMFIGCFSGELADTGEEEGGPPPGGPPPGGAPPGAPPQGPPA